MIIPTADYDPLFADDGVPFRQKMWQYIRHEFGDMLGPLAGLSDEDLGQNELLSPGTDTETRQRDAA